MEASFATLSASAQTRLACELLYRSAAAWASSCGSQPNPLRRLRLQANLMFLFRPQNDEVSDLFASIARDVMPSTRSARAPSQSAD